MSVEGVELRPFASEYIATTGVWLQDAWLRAQIDTVGAPAPAENEAYWNRRLADSHQRSYAIFERHEHVGNCGLLLCHGGIEAELWLYIGRERDRGLGRAALELLLEIAFEELELTRLVLRTVASNADAAQFWEKQGFVTIEEVDAIGTATSTRDQWFELVRSKWRSRVSGRLEAT